MPKITRDQVRVPADVMPDMRDVYITNYMKATRETGRLMLFACDQKIEHMNKDFYGEGIDIADAEPEHLFKIGSQGACGVVAGQRAARVGLADGGVEARGDGPCEAVDADDLFGVDCHSCSFQLAFQLARWVPAATNWLIQSMSSSVSSVSGLVWPSGAKLPPST